MAKEKSEEVLKAEAKVNFVSKDVLNMIEKVVSERPAENQKNAESEVVEDAEDGGENE